MNTIIVSNANTGVVAGSATYANQVSQIVQQVFNAKTTAQLLSLMTFDGTFSLRDVVNAIQDSIASTDKITEAQTVSLLDVVNAISPKAKESTLALIENDIITQLIPQRVSIGSIVSVQLGNTSAALATAIQTYLQTGNGGIGWSSVISINVYYDAVATKHTAIITTNP